MKINIQSIKQVYEKDAKIYLDKFYIDCYILFLTTINCYFAYQLGLYILGLFMIVICIISFFMMIYHIYQTKYYLEIAKSLNQE